MSSKTDQIRSLRESGFERWKARQSVNNQHRDTEGLIINKGRKDQIRRAQQTWRQRNQDLNRQRAKEGMRKLRAAEKLK